MFMRPTLLAFAITVVGATTACEHPAQNDAVGVKPSPPQPEPQPVAASELPAPPAPTPAPTPPPPPSVQPSPPPARPPAPAPVAAPPAPPTIILIAPPQQPPPSIVNAPCAPLVQPTMNSEGTLVPAVPLWLDPGAPPGAPNNGAPGSVTP